MKDFRGPQITQRQGSVGEGVRRGLGGEPGRDVCGERWEGGGRFDAGMKGARAASAAPQSDGGQGRAKTQKGSRPRVGREAERNTARVERGRASCVSLRGGGALRETRRWVALKSAARRRHT